MQIEASSLFSLPDGLELTSLAVVGNMLTIHVTATAQSRPCPLCTQEATHVRSYYTRLVADVPCAGRQVQLILHVRKFRCDTVSCPRKIFAERLGPFVEAWARKTTRLRQAIEAIGLSTCGEGGARLAARLAIATSPTTILRRIMALPLPPVETVTHLGIDDFALRRGRTYGTVLVDLRRHKVIDLLPDRKAETAKTWMQAHSEIELVSRDRGGDYATAASQGAPQAVQTADRFHLCKNLTDAVEKALARCRAEIRKSQKAEQKSAKETELKTPPPRLLTSDGKPYSAHQTERYDRYQQVIALREQGATVKDIAKRVGLGKRTIQRWLKDGTYVETNYHHRHRSRFDSYESYVRKRWDEGVHNIQQIWREIKAASDILIPIERFEAIWKLCAGKSLLSWKRLASWTTFPQRKPSGSSFVPLMTCRSQSKKNFWLCARPALRPWPCINSYRIFFAWCMLVKEHNSTPG
jgi:transposase